MTYCLNLNYQDPHNEENATACVGCGAQLLLKERYRPLRLLGQGGFARTFEARDRDRLNTPCVIKQFLPAFHGPAALQKATTLFQQEAHRLYQLGKHPQIPDLMAYFERDNSLYLIQDFVKGQNLFQELQQQGAFSEDKIWHLLGQLLPVLQFIHDRAVIHRDIKPHNILRDLDEKLVLIDFGVSKQLTGSTLTQRGTVTGTPGYVPLEQLRGQVYPASDLYSLGVTCIRLLTGCFLAADGTDELYDPLEGVWVWESKLAEGGKQVSDRLSHILNRLLQETVKSRYQSAAEVLEALRHRPIVFSSEHASPAESVALESEVGADYRRLRYYLAAGEWQKGDRETTVIMLRVAGRENIGWFDKKSLEQFPATDLKTIDRLWLIYSNGKFGFSVQNRIWQSIQRKNSRDATAVKRFAEKIGWRVENRWVYYQNVCFSPDAPEGHLPLHFTARWGSGFQVCCGWAIDTLSALLAREELTTHP